MPFWISEEEQRLIQTALEHYRATVLLYASSPSEQCVANRLQHRLAAQDAAPIDLFAPTRRSLARA